MIKTKTAIAFDTLIVTIIIFFIFYVWVYKILKNAFLSLFICNLISIITFIAIFNAAIKKYNILNLKQKDLKFAKNCLHSLQYFSSKSNTEFFEKLFNAKEISENIYESNNLIIYINLKEPLTSKHFFFAHDFFLLSNTNKRLIFIANLFDDSFLTANQNSKTVFDTFDFTELFKVMKQKQLFPTTNIESEKINFKFFKNKFTKGLTKNNFKNFFFSGLSLLAFSFFIPYSTHYLLIGTFLLLLSIVCLFKKSTPTKPSKTSLEEQIKK